MLIRIKTVYVNVRMWLNASLWQWCHFCSPPSPNLIHSLTLLSPWQHRPAVSPAGLSWRVQGTWGGSKEEGWGWLGWQLSRCKSPSWVCWGQALSQPPRSRAAAQAPAVLMIAPNRPGTSSLWWLAEEPVEAELWSLTAWTSWHPLNTHHHRHHYSRPKLSQTKHACKCAVPIWPLTTGSHVIHTTVI